MTAEEGSPLTDPGLESLWRHVLDHWEEEAAHVAFLQNAKDRGRLADAAARYRGMTGDHRRKEMAEKQLAAITALAFAQIDASRSSPPRTSRLVTAVALGVILVLSLIIVLAARA